MIFDQPLVVMDRTQLWLTQIPAIMASAATLLIAYTGFRKMKHLQGKAATKAAEDAAHAAEKVEGVRLNLEGNQRQVTGQLESIEQTGKDTHTLVNNKMAIQLKINADKSRRLAEITKDPADILEALEAERMLDEHLGRQGNVDRAVQSRREKLNDEQSQKS